MQHQIAVPAVGQIVRVRSRQYLVQGVVGAPSEAECSRVAMACVEDDALGEQLEVLWEAEIDAQILNQNGWQELSSRGFDDPKLFSAYLNTLRWGCVTATKPKLFQAPYRAGIEVKAFQLEPLRKALLMPRVNLFIADDVGLGKTIEAGLILRELLMRQKVRRVVVACPPSVVRQWQEEMEARFGLSFEIFDRDFFARKRQERGYGVNPWTTHSRFIISHALIRNETYAGPLRDWLGDFGAGSMLILDEAHNAAPASAAKYAIDSKLTKSIRDLARRFEHKLFLSATPHNGHSNSFSALLEMLDPQKFCRGVPVVNSARDQVMVRRLKHDLREIGESFPERQVVRIEIDGLPKSAPELQLSSLLHEYRQLKEANLASQTKGRKAAAMLVLTSLQKRLLSSIEAFARTLSVHRKSLEKQLSSEKAAGDQSAKPIDSADLDLLRAAPSGDDERAGLSEEAVDAEADAQMAAASEAATAPKQADRGKQLEAELKLVKQMSQIAEKARYKPDSRLKHLVEWLKQNLCADLGKQGAAFEPKRVLIFTEYADTKRYLQQQLQQAFGNSDPEGDRIDTFHGGMGDERREEIKRAFNGDPDDHPLRVLIATDAAREGVNLQNHCADLFHFDVPWNPGRMEQRNGRIDRKLQRSPVVRCHYFVLNQRAEDRVLSALVEKSEVIFEELGSLAPVVAKKVDELLATGIAHSEAEQIAQDVEEAGEDAAASQVNQVIVQDLEGSRERRQSLSKQVENLKGMLKESKEWLGLSDGLFRSALSASLELVGQSPLEAKDAKQAAEDADTAAYVLPKLNENLGGDGSWQHTLDALRSPRKPGQKVWEWRKEAPIRPVIFRDAGTMNQDVVHLHLEHRVVQRLLGRFISQGFAHNELSRACVLLTDEPLAKVLALGRLSLYGENAARLHDQVIAVAAEYVPAANRGRRKLTALPQKSKADVLTLLYESLQKSRLHSAPKQVKKLIQAGAERDIAELLPQLNKRAAEIEASAAKQLEKRAAAEAKAMAEILLGQQKLIQTISADAAKQAKQLTLGFNKDEKRQFAANQKHWAARLAALEEEITSEPERIREGYQVQASRIEPVGLVYLWPVSG